MGWFSTSFGVVLLFRLVLCQHEHCTKLPKRFDGLLTTALVYAIGAIAVLNLRTTTAGRVQHAQQH